MGGGALAAKTDSRREQTESISAEHDVLSPRYARMIAPNGSGISS